MWDFFSFEFFLIILCCFSDSLMINRFCKKYMQISRKKEILCLILFIGSRIGNQIIYKTFKFPYIIFAVWNHMMIILVIILLFHAGKEKKLLAGAILVTARTLVWNFSESLLSCFILFFLYIMKGETDPIINMQNMYLIFCMHIIMGILFIEWLSKYLGSVFDEKTNKYYIIVSIPLLLITMIEEIAAWGASNGIMIYGGETWGIYYNQIFSHIGNCILTILCMFASGFYLFGMDKIDLEQRKREQYQLQVSAYKMIEEHYRQMERLRHDMKNHMISLHGMLEYREWDKMEAYLEKMEAAGNFVIDREGEIVGSTVVSALIYKKRRLAEEKNITWTCDMQVPKECGIDEFDFCILFGNILDNAIEACEKMDLDKNKWIEIQCKKVKKCLLLEVKNSMKENFIKKEKVSINARQKGHGIGLFNVNDMVQKYNGVINIEMEQRTFLISILLPLERTKG